ncbi:MAG: ABC transporter permease subunit, partial [Spirochaetes bacterium]|nr:ABC transporter permease subunit [Spirochaetota bacterium]
ASTLIRFLNFLAALLINGGVIGKVSVRKLDFTWCSIITLTLGYSAFISEIFRAGIESIRKGRMEAALALGMRRWQAMRKIILPQAVRNVLPPPGNEFVAILKDLALLSALGVQDITPGNLQYCLFFLLPLCNQKF